MDNNAFCADRWVIIKGESAPAGAIIELVRNDNITGVDMFLQAATGTHTDQELDAQHFEAKDIGALVEACRADAVAATMAGEKGHALTIESAHDIVVGRRAEG